MHTTLTIGTDEKLRDALRKQANEAMKGTFYE
jgi:hypothetical protein